MWTTLEVAHRIISLQIECVEVLLCAKFSAAEQPVHFICSKISKYGFLSAEERRADAPTAADLQHHPGSNL